MSEDSISMVNVEQYEVKMRVCNFFEDLWCLQYESNPSAK